MCVCVCYMYIYIYSFRLMNKSSCRNECSRICLNYLTVYKFRELLLCGIPLALLSKQIWSYKV